MFAARRLAAPRSFRTGSITATAVTLKWSAPKRAKPAYYVVLRDGKAIARTKRSTYTDHKVKAGRTYRYSVRAYDAAKRAGAPTRSVRVKVPQPAPEIPTNNPLPPVAAVTPAPLPGDPGVVPAPEPIPEPTPHGRQPLTEAMVDRLFWRAGFGPTEAARATWTGRRLDELVDFFVNTPAEPPPVVDGHPTSDLAGIYTAYYGTLARPPKDSTGNVIDPNASDTELELEWIDRMQRAGNPLPDRLALFWHRHWAISRDDGIANHLILQYRNRLLRYADFGANPNASFRDLAFEMTTKDAAMSQYLNINQNVKGKPNENYARELMELFCLGPNAPDGTPNYTQDDVAGLAKALTGWTFNGTSTSALYGTTTFTPSRFELTAKTFLGLTLPAYARVAEVTAATGPATVGKAVDAVLAHPNHAQFLIRKLWAEFIASPIPQETLDALVAAYRADYRLKPLIRAILAHPLLMESIDEPNLIKPPMVFIVGALRQFDAPLKANQIEQSMNATQQKVYFPPNVSGWEGGFAWLNTNTVQGRFDLIARLQLLKYSNFYDGATHYLDPAASTPEGWFTLAHQTLNRPWVSAETKQAIVKYATDNPLAANPSAAARRQRLYVLQALILGGPDGQVM